MEGIADSFNRSWRRQTWSPHRPPTSKQVETLRLALILHGAWHREGSRGRAGPQEHHWQGPRALKSLQTTPKSRRWQAGGQGPRKQETPERPQRQVQQGALRETAMPSASQHGPPC